MSIPSVVQRLRPALGTDPNSPTWWDSAIVDTTKKKYISKSKSKKHGLNTLVDIFIFEGRNGQISFFFFFFFVSTLFSASYNFFSSGVTKPRE